MGAPSVSDISSMVRRIRERHGWQLRGEPRIIYVRAYDDELYIVVHDRSDRAVMVGYGGLVVKELKRELGVGRLWIVAYTDLLLKHERIKIGLKALTQESKRLSPRPRGIVARIKRLALAELSYPPRRIPRLPELRTRRVVVAFSGGVDSTATLFLSKLIGLNPIAVTVRPAPFIVPPQVVKRIRTIAERLNVDHVFVKPPVSYDDIVKATLEGRAMPCGACSRAIEEAVLSYAKSIGVRVVLFGDSLPTGRFSVRYYPSGMLRVNLPGLLSLNKSELEVLAREAGHEGLRYRYGCPLLREGLKRHRWMRYIAIERVLRETRAGILEPMDALRYIKDILSLGGR